MKITIRILTWLVVLAIAGIGIWWFTRPEEDERGITPAKIEDVQGAVKLATLRIYEEIPVKGSVGKRHIVARQKLEGSVSYDLEKINLSYRNDTVVVSLPRETVELRESTLPDSYVVIDEWNDNFFGSGKMKTDEENAIKRRILDNAVNRVYSQGYINKARNCATESVSRLIKLTTGLPVVVEFE